MGQPTRRDLLRAAPLAALPLLGGRAAGQGPAAAKDDPAFPGMTVRMHEPRNLETPLSALLGPADPKTGARSLDTPTEHFYVRSHFATPAVDPKTWALSVEGHVESPLTFTLDELKKLPEVTKRLTLECAGNGRVFLTPAARGLQWAFGGVSTAEWTGVALSSVLAKAKPKAGAVDVVMVGADTGAITADPPTPGTIHYDRGISLAKATKPETLLAWAMNGQPLTASHGAPVRAVVGGWYGMASVKWLTRIVVTDAVHAGYWQTMDYSYFTRGKSGQPSLQPVTAGRPKAIVTSPTEGQVLKVGAEVAVTGLAWAGESAAAKVEASLDGGTTWAAAELKGTAEPFVWRPWRWAFTPKAAGPVRLLARCTDATGRTQPDKRDPDLRTYMIHHTVPVELLAK